uniref:PPUP8211 n=1 Tax=Poeciliopsis prolifica TaxID=188132 RepID=A0A0S7ELA4_9TELE
MWLWGHCGSKHENVTQADSRSRRERCTGKRTKTTQHSGGHLCQASEYFQEMHVTKLNIVLIRFLHVLPGDCLHSRPFLLACLFNFQASPSLSPLYKEGADGEALERELQRYV